MAKKLDNKTIYEIYRSCRLCGSDTGYKMPIIQSAIGIKFKGFDLRKKIRDYVRIEVRKGDKMPPLICELCIGKLSDFQEFIENCQDTNNRTRRRLGLRTSDNSLRNSSEDCILGVTEPIFTKDINSHTESQKQQTVKKPKPMGPKCHRERMAKLKLEEEAAAKIKEEENRRKEEKLRLKAKKKEKKKINKELLALQSEVKKLDLNSSRESRITKKPQSSPRPPRSNAVLDDPVTSQNDFDSDDEMALIPSVKRTRDRNQIKLEIPSKKLKITMNLPQKYVSPTKNETPKSVKDSSKDKIIKEPPKTPKEPVKTSKEPVKTSKELVKTSKETVKPSKVPKYSEARFSCAICESPMKTPQALINHLKVHTIKYTDPNMACNACGEWFVTTAEVDAHHKKHGNKSPYKCRYCKVKHKSLEAFDEHYVTCVSKHLSPSPDVQCRRCWKYFVTDTLRDSHKCHGQSRRPIKCRNCDKLLSSTSNLNRHLKACTGKVQETKTIKASEVKIPAKLKRKLKPAQVRIVRFDAILTKNRRRNTFDVASIQRDFGLDKSCTYPYMNVRKANVKSEPLSFNGMVSINQEIRNELYREEDYVHWDSDLSSDSDLEEGVDEIAKKKIKKVPNLTILSLKTIFSKRCLGKVPRKLRKVKQDKLFESLFNFDDTDNNINLGQIINNLNDNIDSEKNNDNVDKNNDSGYKNKECVDKIVDSNEILQFNDENEDSDSLLDKSILSNLNFEQNTIVANKVESEVNDGDKNNDTEMVFNNDKVNDTTYNGTKDDVTLETNTYVNESVTDASMNSEDIKNDYKSEENPEKNDGVKETSSDRTEKSNGDFENGVNENDACVNDINEKVDYDNDKGDNGKDDFNDSKINNDIVDKGNNKIEKYTELSDSSDRLMAAVDEQLGDIVNVAYTKKDFTTDDFEF